MNLEYDEIILQKCEYTKYLLTYMARFLWDEKISN